MPNFDFILRINDGPALIDELTAAQTCGYGLTYFRRLQALGFHPRGVPMPIPQAFRDQNFYPVDEFTAWLAQFGQHGPRMRSRRHDPEAQAVRPHAAVMSSVGTDMHALTASKASTLDEPEWDREFEQMCLDAGVSSAIEKLAS